MRFENLPQAVAKDGHIDHRAYTLEVQNVSDEGRTYAFMRDGASIVRVWKVGGTTRVEAFGVTTEAASVEEAAKAVRRCLRAQL